MARFAESSRLAADSWSDTLADEVHDSSAGGTGGAKCSGGSGGTAGQWACTWDLG